MIKNRIVYNTFSNYQFTVKAAKDSFLYTDLGEKLIDFTSGWNVANLGWNNKEIADAMIKQVKKNVYIPQWTSDPIQEKYASYFAKALNNGLEVFTRETAGVNANIMAIKTARAYTGKRKIVSFRDSFHGSLYHTLQLGYAPEYAISKAIFLNFENHIHIEYPKVTMGEKNEKEILSNFSKKIEETLSSDKDIAAIVAEAGIVTGWGSTYVAPVGFISEIRRLTNKYKILLILDEVGTGFSRCGKLFGMQIENVVPDIATFAKGMVNGASAIGTMVTTKEIGEATYSKTNPQSTFGWTPVAVAAALKTIEIHKRDKVWEKAKKDGKYLLDTLQNELKNNPLIEDINGVGMEIGVRFRKIDGKKPISQELIKIARKKGLHLAYCDDYNHQIMPPLTIKKSDLDHGIEVFVKAVNSFK